MSMIDPRLVTTLWKEEVLVADRAVTSFNALALKLAVHLEIFADHGGSARTHAARHLREAAFEEVMGLLFGLFDETSRTSSAMIPAFEVHELAHLEGAATSQRTLIFDLSPSFYACLAETVAAFHALTK
eukprot:TRINITY_DN5033_c0_g2_i13.p3 TRINITY_DN5033_c0_g2~~TRINITY_DN5033_c0_g2_i13.p3  ORF type:complete len:129 (-),score=3.34 TRINITY_DN5033_c0_g2_i13:480-866(-)